MYVPTTLYKSSISLCYAGFNYKLFVYLTPCVPLSFEAKGKGEKRKREAEPLSWTLCEGQAGVVEGRSPSCKTSPSPR